MCPPSLAFDLELQACNWRDQVKNCDKTTKTKKVRPLTATKDPLCEVSFSRHNVIACLVILNLYWDIYLRLFKLAGFPFCKRKANNSVDTNERIIDVLLYFPVRMAS